jgi:hypothetical protein
MVIILAVRRKREVADSGVPGDDRVLMADCRPETGECARAT